MIALCAFASTPAAAGPAAKRDWRQEKCFRYARDWDEALRRYGRDGFSADFLAGERRLHPFGLRRERVKICPATPKDRELVDVLAIRVVNEGMSTTFLPFDCPSVSALQA